MTVYIMRRGVVHDSQSKGLEDSTAIRILVMQLRIVLVLLLETISLREWCDSFLHATVGSVAGCQGCYQETED